MIIVFVFLSLVEIIYALLKPILINFCLSSLVPTKQKFYSPIQSIRLLSVSKAFLSFMYLRIPSVYTRALDTHLLEIVVLFCEKHT